MLQNLASTFRRTPRLSQGAVAGLLVFLLTAGDTTRAFRQFLPAANPVRGGSESEERNSGGSEEEESRGGHSQHGSLVHRRARGPHAPSVGLAAVSPPSTTSLTHRSLAPLSRTPRDRCALLSPLRC